MTQLEVFALNRIDHVDDVWKT